MQVSRMICTVPLISVLLFPILAMAQVDVRPGDDEAAKRTWGKVVQGQAVSIVVKKSVYAPEEQIGLSICFKNLGHEDVQVVQANTLRVYQVDVILPDGNDAPITLYGKSAFERDEQSQRTVITLKPNEQQCVELELNRLYDLSLAGRYKVVVHREVWKSERRSENVKVTSNTLEIAIDERLEGSVPESSGKQ